MLTTALIVVILSACAGAGNMRSDKSASLYPPASVLPESQTLSGSYLAARFAQRQQDWNAAQNYMNSVVGIDSENATLLHRTFLLSVGAGEFTRSRDLAHRLLAQDSDSDVAVIFLAADAIVQGDFAYASTLAEKLPDDGFGQYTKPLLTVWSLAGAGRMDDARAMIDLYASPDDITYNIHAALLHDMAGDTDAATKHYRAAMENGLTLQTAGLAMSFFDRQGNTTTADAIRQGLAAAYPLSPLKADKDAKNETITPAHGMGVAMFELASLLYERRSHDSAQIYARMAGMLMPESPFVALLLGDLAAINQQYGEAISFYNRIPPEATVYWLSRMRVAEIYEIDNHTAAAIRLLGDMAQKPALRVQALTSLGDLHRRLSDFPRAVAAYDTALKEAGDISADHWSILYARGMAHERTGNWTAAEQDLLQALEFQPDNPMILNYIGYSWAEKGVNLDSALDYLGRAVTIRPDDGFILDSYGWVLHRVGRHAEAVEWLERAVAVLPDEAIILDHLGDVYWQIGRRDEARFKWQHAREVSVDDAFKAAVSNKITHGIVVDTTIHASR